jgi:hypothetical protein
MDRTMLTKQKPAATAPARKAGKRKRPQLGIIVTQETKNRVEQMARDSNRSMGQVAEQLIEEALYTRRLMSDLQSIEGAGTKVLAFTLFRHLWSPIRTDQGDEVWAPPGTKYPITITRKP